MYNLLDVYTRLKLRIDNEVIVTFYNYGCKYTRNYILLDVDKFDKIYVRNDNGDTFYINFFDNVMMIETIKIPNYGLPIYNNLFIDDNIFNDGLISDSYVSVIRNKVIGNEKINFNDRDSLINRYMERDNVFKYDDLFFSSKQKEEFELFFVLLIKELSLYAENNGICNGVKFISRGTTSIVYEIGDKIVKIGKVRRCNCIPYCEYILQPIVNLDLIFDGYPIRVEVTEKVYTLDNHDGSCIYTDDDRFNEMVEGFREIFYSIGLSTRDLYPGNIGILLNDNRIQMDELLVDVGNSGVTSIENNNNLRILRKGRFVVVDLDCIWIDDMDKYRNYLEYIGINKNDAINMVSNSRCLIRK